MARKVKYPEVLVAEIKMQRSKIQTLQNQFEANKAKIARLQQANEGIRRKATALKSALAANENRAQQNSIPL